MNSYVAFDFLFYFVIIRSSSLFWCLGKAVIRDCGISWVSSLTFPRNSISNYILNGRALLRADVYVFIVNSTIFISPI